MCKDCNDRVSSECQRDVKTLPYVSQRARAQSHYTHSMRVSTYIFKDPSLLVVHPRVVCCIYKLQHSTLACSLGTDHCTVSMTVDTPTTRSAHAQAGPF
jgi:hypothetical protein